RRRRARRLRRRRPGRESARTRPVPDPLPARREGRRRSSSLHASCFLPSLEERRVGTATPLCAWTRHADEQHVDFVAPNARPYSAEASACVTFPRIWVMSPPTTPSTAIATTETRPRISAYSTSA